MAGDRGTPATITCSPHDALRQCMRLIPPAMHASSGERVSGPGHAARGALPIHASARGGDVDVDVDVDVAATMRAFG